METRTRIINACLYAPERTLATEITLQGPRILALGDPLDDRPPDVTLDAAGGMVVPGLIDALVHGGGGAESMSARVDETRTIARSHARFGTTALCVGTTASPMSILAKVLEAIAEVTRHPADDGARVLGSYVEGLFGSVGKRGAHPPEHVRKPTIDGFEEVWAASHATLRVLSYAPEADHGLRLTRYLAERRDALGNLVPAMGHTDATYDQARRSFDAGIRRATHLFNGMSDLHHRRMGAVEAVLDDPRVHAEMIGDGVHVAPPWVRFAMRLRSPANLGLITDAHGASALLPDEVTRFFEPDPQSGVLVSRDGRGFHLRDGAVYIGPKGDLLCGSIITLRDAVRNAIQWGASIEDAVTMATASPAENLGLPRKGRLVPGYDADVVVFDADWNPRAVFVEGRRIRNELALARSA